MKKNLVLTLLLLVIAATSANAQVTIGSESAPHPGALLDLRQNDNTGANSTKGLLLPRVNLTAYDELTVAGDEFAATGMIVWNTNAFALRGVGTYQWDGTQWLEMKAAGIDYGVLPSGTGTFSGKMCFDIALGNDGENYSVPIEFREGQKTDFSETTEQDNIATGPYTGVQIYTFTPVGGAVSKVRFAYEEETLGEGLIVESIVPQETTYATGVDINTTCKVAVHYKSTLQGALSGRTQLNALKLKLYAIYNANSDGSGGASADRKVELTVRLQDGACCGAFVAANTWQPFMCYNLGADYTADPFTPSRDINGSYYQWGSKTAILTQNAGDDATPFESGTWNSTAPSTFYGSDGTTLGNQDDNAKSDTDPCPSGYRVPTLNEWQGVVDNNPDPNLDPFWVGTDPWIGRWLSPALFLPAAGTRILINGSLSNRGIAGYYWSTSVFSLVTSAYILNFNKDHSFKQTSGASRAYGFSIRCIAEN